MAVCGPYETIRVVEHIGFWITGKLFTCSIRDSAGGIAHRVLTLLVPE
jgi:hypothetical protein